MTKVEEKLAKSLTAESTELIPYLPYLLQDLWELGSSPKDIIDMIANHLQVSEKTKILDLACGKGAVSIQIAKAFGCKVKGIDIIKDFIDYANKKALEHGVEDLCQFQAGDINEEVAVEKGFDIVILGAVGDVLGNPLETISKLKNTVKSGGYIFIDDAYGNNGFNETYYLREEWISFFKKAKVKLLDEKFNIGEELKNNNYEQQLLIVKRAEELKDKYPDKVHLFDSYIKSQREECDELENDIKGVTMLLQRE
ncbi:MAG: class I SAM-dependent methyltransferase [Clostridiales bacterium]|nr:class I SAM-dependent methyltransferase [Clostridiales bacterium]